MHQSGRANPPPRGPVRYTSEACDSHEAWCSKRQPSHEHATRPPRYPLQRTARSKLYSARKHDWYDPTQNLVAVFHATGQNGSPTGRSTCEAGIWPRGLVPYWHPRERSQPTPHEILLGTRAKRVTATKPGARNGNRATSTPPAPTVS